jgi:hypothetical protein
MVVLLVFDYDIDGVNDAGDVTQDRQQDIDPEVQADADLEEHAERRQQDGKEDSQDVHESAFPVT